MKRRYDRLSGVPIFNAMEKHLLDAALISVPCKVCNAKAGDQCLKGKYNPESGKMVYTQERYLAERQDNVHMGRLPSGFCSDKVVDKMVRRMKGLYEQSKSKNG